LHVLAAFVTVATKTVEGMVDIKNGIKAITNRDSISAYEEDVIERKEVAILWTIFGILLVLWLFGLISGHTIGGFIHILLVIAIVVVLIRVIQGRRIV
jgi:hypothetical protein